MSEKEKIKLSGTVETIVFRNDDTGFTVLDLAVDDQLVTVVGEVLDIAEGEEVTVTGSYTTHGTYGTQFKAEIYERVMPATEGAIRKYLTSGAVRGIGPVLAGRLVKRFGLLSYGCCERVDAIWSDYLSKWENLRKLSVSPFNNEDLVGEYLRGSRVVYYSKPRAELVTVPGAMDEDAVHKDFKRICQAASGCLFEIGQREVMTLCGDLQRGKRYVEIAKECVERYWRP